MTNDNDSRKNTDCTHEISSLQEYEDYLMKRYERYELYKGRLFYRGQSGEYKTFPPTIARDAGYAQNEAKIYEEAISMAKEEEFSGLHFPIERLSKMQHYGFPTRLIDVTSNFLLALYFAVEEINNVSFGNVYVYIADGHDMESDQVQVLSLLATIPELSVDEVIQKYEELYDVTLSRSQVLEYCDKPVFMSYSESLGKSNPRLHNQKGTFLICGNKVVDDGISSEIQSLDIYYPMDVIRIPYEYKERILNELDLKYGINESIIYPELPSIADYIKRKYRQETANIGYRTVESDDSFYFERKGTWRKIILNDNGEVTDEQKQDEKKQQAMRIGAIKSTVLQIIDELKNEYNSMSLFIYKTSDDLITNNWILRSHWIDPDLKENLKPMPLGEKDEANEGVYWTLGKSSSLRAEYNERLFVEDKTLFISNHKTFEAFMQIHTEILNIFKKNDIDSFKTKFLEHKEHLGKLCRQLGDFGMSKDIEFNNLLNCYESLSSFASNIDYASNSNENPMHSLSIDFDTFQKDIDIILKQAPIWKDKLGITDEEYSETEPAPRKKSDYQYVQKIPVSETAIDVFFEVQIKVNEDKTINIFGKTNLFDEAILSLSINAKGLQMNLGKVTILNGEFNLPVMKKFELGQYHLSIVLPIYTTQSKDFIEKVGIQYENLKGEFVKREGIAPTIKYGLDFVIK